MPQLETGFFLFSRFFIPQRRLSRASWKQFAETFNRTGVIKDAIDELVSSFATVDLTVALSSAYDWIYSLVKVVRLHAANLAVPVPERTSVVVMRSLGASVIRDLFLSDLNWHPAFQINIHPP